MDLDLDRKRVDSLEVCLTKLHKMTLTTRESAENCEPFMSTF
jgi:hypothetical protein